MGYSPGSACVCVCVWLPTPINMAQDQFRCDHQGAPASSFVSSGRALPTNCNSSSSAVVASISFVSVGALRSSCTEVGPLSLFIIITNTPRESWEDVDYCHVHGDNFQVQQQQEIRALFRCIRGRVSSLAFQQLLQSLSQVGWPSTSY